MHMRIKSILKSSIVSSSVVILPLITFAQEATKKGELIDTPEKVMGVFKNLTNWLFTGLIVFSVVMLIVAAYKYLFSQGSEEATGSAKKTILYATIALAVGMVARGVPALVESLLKTN
jgi:cytochrome bd-type quinol oxidase subunit 2